MEQIKHALTAMIILAFGISANAQDVSGSNLNIGTNNVIATGSTAGSAIGDHLRVYSNYSLAIGFGDTLTQGGHNSLVVGGSNKMGGSGSISAGLNNQVLTDYSIGFGRYVKTSANAGCMAIGVGLYGTQTRPALYMENQYDNSLMIGFLSTRPTFTVSPSYTDYFNDGNITNRTGKVAIGDIPIPDIAAKLHIRSDEGEDAGIILEPKDLENSSTFIRMRDEYHGIDVDKDGVTTIKSLALGYNGYEIKRPLLLKGIVGVNVPEDHRDDLTNAYALWVNGGVITEKVTIKATGSWWSDYVFNPDYPLMPTGDLREYIGANRHLPDVPSEAEVMEKGIELGDMQSILLKKIEELTLYMLQQQETIDRLETRIAELEDR